MLIEKIKVDFVKSERVQSKNGKPLQFLTFGRKYESEQMLCSNELDFTGLTTGSPIEVTLDLKKDGFNFNAFVTDVTLVK